MRSIPAIAASAVITALLASGAWAQTQGAAAPAPAPADQPAAPTSPPKQICKREPPSLETTIPKKICHTKAEWEQIAKYAEENAKAVGRSFDNDQH